MPDVGGFPFQQCSRLERVYSTRVFLKTLLFCSLFTIAYVYEYRRYCLCAFAWNTPNRIILLQCHATMFHQRELSSLASPLHTLLWFCAQVDISIYEYMLKSTNFPSVNKCVCGRERPERMCAWHLPDITFKHTWLSTCPAKQATTTTMNSNAPDAV